MRLAVIPARGGSKRIPRKNIRLFCGQPMIAWSIAAALKSGCFDRIIVSTDDAEIAAVARRHGADVPFLRPAHLADDHTTTLPVVAHAIAWQQQHGVAASQACCIYATAPFVQAADLQRGLGLLTSSGCDYALSVTSFPFPVQRAIRIGPAGRLVMVQPEHLNTRSQDLPETYHDAGQFYWGQAAAWMAGRAIFSARAAPIILPRHRVQDIDSAEDWVRAEWLFKAMASAPADDTGP